MESSTAKATVTEYRTAQPQPQSQSTGQHSSHRLKGAEHTKRQGAVRVQDSRDTATGVEGQSAEHTKTQGALKVNAPKTSHRCKGQSAEDTNKHGALRAQDSTDQSQPPPQ